MKKQKGMLGGNILDLTPYLGKVMSRVELVGIELEGGWKKFPEDSNLEHDGSVKDLWKTPQEKADYPFSGECVSEPMIPANVGVWMRNHYPDVINHTCGLHVHMSFKTAKQYSMLMEIEYPTTMNHYLLEWAKEEGLKEDHLLFKRIKGENDTCLTNKFWPDAQARMTRKDYDKKKVGNRYTGINYCFLQHGTMECRVLPMFDSCSRGVRAVNRVLAITNACLVALASRDKGARASVDLEMDTVEESHTISYV